MEQFSTRAVADQTFSNALQRSLLSRPNPNRTRGAGLLLVAALASASGSDSVSAHGDYFPTHQMVVRLEPSLVRK